jgi:hypothetical protein
MNLKEKASRIRPMAAPATAKIIAIEDYRMDSDTQETARYFEYRRLLRKALTPTEYLIFDILLDMANEELNDGWCWPSYTEISDRAGGLAPKTISDAVERLEGLELLTVERPASKLTRNVANRYRPLKGPGDKTIALLEWVATDRIASKNEAKKRKNHRFKKQINSKNEASSLQKMKTNESNLTNPNLKPIPNGIEPPPKIIASKNEVNEPTKQPKEVPKIYARAAGNPNPNLEDDLLAWRAIALENNYHYWPNRESQELILRHIPPDQVARWASLIRQWLRKGHKITNVDGMVKVFWFGWDDFYKGLADNRPIPLAVQKQVQVQVQDKEGIKPDAAT